MLRAFLGLGGAGLLCLLLVVPAPAADNTVKVGVTKTFFPNLSGKRLRKAAEPFKGLVQSVTGISGEVAEGGEAETLAAILKNNEAHVGIFQGFEFAWAKAANPKLEPIVIFVNQKRTLEARLIVRAGTPLKEPGDLRGKTLAVPRELRAHCNLFLERKCVSADSTPKKFYRKILTAEDVEEALDEVVDGNAQAAVVDSVAWESYRESKPGAAKKLRVLLESEPFPCAVLACQEGRLSILARKRLRDGLIGAKNTRRGRDVLQQARLTAFEAVPDDYERQLAAIAKAYPPPKAK